ncbi:MAG: hypothetical protein AAF681_12590, partial [Pseudomonadota bacterium]
MTMTAGLTGETPLNDERDVSVDTFVGTNGGYYSSVFESLQRGELPRWHFNIWGVFIPWLWAAYRGVWVMFWISIAIDLLAIVCLMQLVKFAPLLAEAQLNPSENATLIERYTRWIANFSSVGWALLIVGRLWMGSSANRWYYAQYSRWRINKSVPNWVSAKRVICGLVIAAIVMP